MVGFNPSRAKFKGPELFPRFTVENQGEALSAARLRPSTLLIVAERNGERRAFLLSEMAYHHVAEGELGGEPFCVAFCVPCHIGVGINPILDGRRLHFSAGGVSEAMLMLVDDETQTYWRPATGEALHGPLAGRQLEIWPVSITTVREALKSDPGLRLSRTRINPFTPKKMMVTPWTWAVRSKSVLPPGFRKTISRPDERRPEMEHGLGVVVGDRARYYPLEVLQRGLREEWEGRSLYLKVQEEDGLPKAEWEDGERPFQLFTRWYGFSLTYPGCEVVQPE
ncbi:MAG TPA: DUF3179 domain-containing (seleno)protein [Thermoanaerobaculia bacterium]|nr:DUF3179 domain-containing (seleno)protein [Thermoanaerobaculia bacterium]